MCRVSGYLDRVYVSYCWGLHSLGCLQHLLRNLIADIGILVVGARPVLGTSPLAGLVNNESLLILQTLSQNNWLRHTWYGSAHMGYGYFLYLGRTGTGDIFGMQQGGRDEKIGQVLGG